MSSVNQVRQQFLNQFGDSASRVVASQLYPDEFEYYLFAFELRDNKNVVTDRLILPVPPSDIAYNDQKLTTIQKTGNGINTLITPYFVPKSISMSGTFGRKFRLLTGYKRDATNQISINEFLTSFSTNVKTGFGALKRLEDIVNRATTVTKKNDPYKMVFYNFASGHTFYVEPMTFTMTQSERESRIWRYNLTLTVVADAQRQGLGFSRFDNNNIATYAQNELNTSLNRLSSILSNVVLD